MERELVRFNLGHKLLTFGSDAKMAGDRLQRGACSKERSLNISGATIEDEKTDPLLEFVCKSLIPRIGDLWHRARARLISSTA